MTRDLSLRGILSEWLREVVGIEGRLPRTLGKLFAHPGFLTRATLEGERDAYLSALKLFLVANGPPRRSRPIHGWRSDSAAALRARSKVCMRVTPRR